MKKLSVAQAKQVLNTVLEIPQDWKIIKTLSKAKIKQIIDDIGEAMYVLDMAGLKQEADQLANLEGIYLDAYLS